MDNQNFTFKQPGDNTEYSFSGSYESFRASHPHATIVNQSPALQWDEKLKKYI